MVSLCHRSRWFFILEGPDRWSSFGSETFLPSVFLLFFSQRETSVAYSFLAQTSRSRLSFAEKLESCAADAPFDTWQQWKLARIGTLPLSHTVESMSLLRYWSSPDAGSPMASLPQTQPALLSKQRKGRDSASALLIWASRCAARGEGRCQRPDSLVRSAARWAHPYGSHRSKLQSDWCLQLTQLHLGCPLGQKRGQPELSADLSTRNSSYTSKRHLDTLQWSEGNRRGSWNESIERRHIRTWPSQPSPPVQPREHRLHFSFLTVWQAWLGVRTWRNII